MMEGLDASDSPALLVDIGGSTARPATWETRTPRSSADHHEYK
jgi:hypothetical protein